MTLVVLFTATLLGSARAHVPHDTVVSVAAPPGLDASAPWTLLANPYEIPLLLRSDDAGRGWSFEGGDPIRDTLLGVARLDDGTLAVLAETRLWWRQEGAWDQEDLPDVLTGLDPDGERLLLAGAHALWSWTPTEGFAEVLSGVGFPVLGDGRVAVDEDDRVWIEGGERWVAVDSPGEPGAVLGADTVYLADLDGQVWRLEDGDWAACGALPQPGPDTTPEIHRLAWDGARVLVAPGWKGPFLSEDGCATWLERAVPGVPDQTAFGQARTAAAVWRTLAASGDTWAIGGFFGFFLSGDAGLTWDERPVLSPAATRALDFSSTYTSDHGAYWGTYAAGVALTHDGGASFIAPSHGLAEGNVQDLRTSDNGQSHVVTVVSGHIPYVSRDNGKQWARFPSLEGQVRRIFPWDGGNEYWVAPSDQDQPALLESLDGGETWAAPEALVAALDGAQPAGAARCQGTCDGRWRCLTAVNPTTLVCSTDGGATWEVWYRGTDGGGGDGDPEGRDAVTEPVLMARDTPEVVIFGDPDGLHRISDEGATWTDTPLADDVPVELACAAGDHVFVATRSGALLRSDDRGVTWADLGLRMTTQATVMVSNPGFPEEPLLLIANLEGVWRLQDPLGSPALVPWTAWQRVDDRSTFFVKQDCPPAMPDVHADMDGRQPLPHGASMTTDVIGETVRVHGLCGAGCAGELRVDGVTRASLAPDPDGGEILAVVGGLAPGWHRVDLVGTGDASLQIDALEATDVAGFVDEPPEARCGCGGARGGATAALLALGLAVPRRRRAR